MRGSDRGSPGSGASPDDGPSAEQLQALAEALGAGYEAYSADSDGRIRVEDLLSAAAAVCGEACMAAAGELDPDAHDLTPGSAVLSDRVNGILCADARDWADTGASVFGIIRTGALAHGYDAADFPPVEEPFRVLAAGIAGADPATSWGRVPLSVGEDHRPRPQPLRQAFELRPAVRALLARAGLSTPLWPVATAGALVVELARVHAAIAPGVAIRLVLETVNGMAKTAPMTPRHYAEATGDGGVSGGATPQAG